MFRRFLFLSALAFLLVPVSCKKKSKLKETNDPRVLEARNLMTEAGFPEGNGFPEVEVLFNTSQDHEKIASFIQEQWRKNLGIEVKLRNFEWKVYLDAMTKLEFQIVRRGWIADYPDPNTFLDMFTTENGNNNTGWGNAKFDQLIKDAAAQRDPKKRLEILSQCEAILMDELPILPLYVYVTQNLRKDFIKGVYENVMGVHPWKEIVAGDGSRLLVMNNGDEPQTLDPGKARGQIEHRIFLGLFEGLTAYDPKTLEGIPGAAEKWELADDGVTWTFHLRDAKWTNGRSVTADDFVFGMLRMMDPVNASDYAHGVSDYLKNGNPYFDGQNADLSLKDFAGSKDENRLKSAKALVAQVQLRHVAALKAALEGEKNAEIQALLKKALEEAPKRKDILAADVGAKAKDARTLILTLENPTPYFLYLTSYFPFFALPREVVEKYGDAWTKPENIVTNGPYRLKEWKPKDYLLMERNPDYWDAGRVKQQQIKLLPVKETATAFTMYANDQCDWLDTVPLDYIDEIKNRPDFHSSPYITVAFYGYNVTKPPLGDKRVRRAMALAVDRDTLIEKVIRGGQKPLYGIVPPGFAGYQNRTFLESGAH